MGSGIKKDSTAMESILAQKQIKLEPLNEDWFELNAKENMKSAESISMLVHDARVKREPLDRFEFSEKENAKTAESTETPLEHGTQVKWKPVWPEVSVNVSDTLFEVVCGDRNDLRDKVIKLEVCSDNSELAIHSRDRKVKDEANLGNSLELEIKHVKAAKITINVPHVEQEPPQGEVSLSADTPDSVYIQPATDSNTVITNNNSLLSELLHAEHKYHKKFCCNVCNYQCAYRSVFKLHMATHNPNKPYSCEHCNYKCSAVGLLNRHTRIHTGEKPYHCNLCEHKFTHARNLKSHQSTHTGEKPYNCKHCGYKCLRPSDLRIHMRSHTGDKPYNCKYCNFKCSRVGNLTTHMRTHTGEKPYQCEHCDYKCLRAADMKRHSAVHTGEKPLSCEYCNYKTARKENLAVHMNKHGN